MPTVEPFSRDMIYRYLTQHKLKYLKYDDGDCKVEFGFDSDEGGELEVYLGAEGKDVDVYVVRVSSTRFIPKSKWGQAITLCNTWNKDKRWPKAYLRVTDPKGCMQRLQDWMGAHIKRAKTVEAVNDRMG